MNYIEFVKQNLKKLTRDELKEKFIKEVTTKDYRKAELEEIIDSIYKSIHN